jgi:serine phosphatase RsbU (regulator of sigma subunit)
LLRKNSGNNSDEILKQILRDVQEFTKGAEQSDDITCGVVKVLE